RMTAGYDPGFRADHRLGARSRLPAPGEPQPPRQLDGLDGEAARDRDQAPRPRENEERQQDCEEQRHARSLGRYRRTGPRQPDLVLERVDVVGAVMAAAVDEEGRRAR